MNTYSLKRSQFYILLVLLTSFSCRKQDPMALSEKELSLQTVDQIFMKWAQANNGRWLPYSVRLAKENSDKLTAPTLETWAAALKPVNKAKAYYRSQLLSRTGKSDNEIDQYLDSLYVRRYNQVNNSLKYRITMDSLFSSYKKLSVVNASIHNQSTSNITNNSGIAGVKSKLQSFITSNDPNVDFYDGANCVPAELTNWFDQHYNNIYSDLIATGSFNLAVEYFLANVGVSDDCAGRLLSSFFLTTMGLKVVSVSETGAETFGSIKCGEATTTIATDLMAYYSCLNEEVPADVLGIVSDGDPFESGLANTYFSSYQLDMYDLLAINKVRMEDNQIDNIVSSSHCKGGVNMAGNIFWTGVREHWLIQLHYLATHPFAEREYWIPEASGNNPLNYGRADLANPSTGEMFEIKPAQNLAAMDAGLIEANTYVTKANQHCLGSLTGATTWRLGTNFPSIILPFSSTLNLEASLAKPGLIGYSRIQKTSQPSAPYIPQSVAQKFKSLVNRLKSFNNFYNLGNAEKIILEYFKQNPDMLNYIKTAAIGFGVALIVGTIVEDFLTIGVGIADDLPCFIMSYRIIRLGLAY